MAELEEALLNTGDEYLKRLGRETAKAIRRTEAEIALWYKRFAKNNNISLAEAKRWLTASELKELKWTVEEYIEYAEKNEFDPRWTKELENASAKVHINRLDALKLELKQSAQIIGQAQKTGIKKVLETVYKDGYYRTAFEFQSALGIGWSLSGVDEARIRKVLSSPWTADGNTFSDRIWKNQQALISELETALTQMIMRGEGPLETAKAVADRFGVAQNRAATLVYTESAAFAESARNDCYKELGVELCRIDGTLDTATCEHCGAVDGTVLKLSDCKVGVTAPPFHPRCRCTTVPHYDDWEEFGITPERIARDAETGEHFEVPANMTYEQWKALQDERHGAGTVDKKRKMHYNEKADIEMYERYSAVVQEFAPKTLEEFVAIKDDNSFEWADLKHKYRILNQYEINSGELTAKEILELDNVVFSEKRTMFKSEYRKGGNIAGAYIDNNINQLYLAHSQIDNDASAYKGNCELVLLKSNRLFQYIDVKQSDGKIRDMTFYDTEAKLFEHLHCLYEKTPFESVTMLSERGMCDSCKGVMAQFKEVHPEVSVNVVSNKKVEGNVWKRRKGEVAYGK